MVPYWQVTGSWIGVSFDDRNAMIGVKLAERLNVQPGDSITLVDHNQRKNLQIKGIVESGDATDNMLIVSLDVAQARLHQPGKISHGLLSVSNDVGRWRTMPAGCRRSILTWRFVRCVRSLLPKGRCWIKLKV